MDAFIDTLIDAFDDAQSALYQHLIQPLALILGLQGQLEQAYEATGWLLIGLLQISAMLLVLLPLERWNPVEPITDQRGIRTDSVI